jgi:two-component system sensor histidine kinase TctE
VTLKSIRVQLLAALLVPLAAVALVQLAFAFRTAGDTAQTVMDQLLFASARSIAEQTSYSENGIETTVPPSALDMFDLGYGDAVYYRVTLDDGRLLAGYPDLEAPYPAEPTIRPHYFNGRFRSRPIRMVAVTQLIPVPAKKARHALVVVGETYNARNAMRDAIWSENSRNQALLVAVALATAWLALHLGLRPLLRLSHAVEALRPGEYRPFSLSALQVELRPFVTALNDYMRRLQEQIEAQRRFTENAAHQLRTPLTLLRTQASYALGRGSDGERSEALRAILATTSQLARLTNQLLSLAKAEPHGQTAAREAVDLTRTTREILEEHGALAVSRELDLAFEVRGTEPAIVLADPAALRDLIVNLIDNAMRYTPAGGQVVVSVGREDASCFLRVEDTGPGIPPQERALVFERFYRIRGIREGETEGSGLGLAIVKEIADSHGAQIALGDGCEGRGLRVEVRFPSAGELAERGRAPREQSAFRPFQEEVGDQRDERKNDHRCEDAGGAEEPLLRRD